MPNSCTFRFFGTLWTLIRKKPDKKNPNLGGECIHGTEMIVINATYTGEMFWSYLMHELFEGAFLCCGAHYQKMYPGEDTVYLVTHDRLDAASEQVRAAYDEIRSKMEGSCQ